MGVKTTMEKRELELRRKTLNASEFAAVVGEHPFKNAGDLYSFHVYETDPPPMNKFMKLGIHMEPSILRWAADELGVQLKTNEGRGVKLIRPDTVFAATLDAKVVAHPWAVDAKFVTGRGEHALWGEQKTDRVPMYIFIQCQMQMYVGDLDVVWIAIFHGLAWDFQLYRVDRNEEVIAGLVEKGNAFWRDHILAQVPPPESVPTLEVLKSIRSVEGEKCRVDPVLVEEWDKARISAKRWKEQAIRLERVVRSSMFDAEFGDFGDEDMVLKCTSTPRRGYTRAVKPTTVRTLRKIKYKPEWKALPLAMPPEEALPLPDGGTE